MTINDQLKSTIESIIETFDEIRDGDPRLFIVLAAARIEAALGAMLEEHVVVDRMPNRFESQANLAMKSGLISRQYHRYITAMRTMRNTIVHRPTRSDYLIEEPITEIVNRLLKLSGRKWEAGQGNQPLLDSVVAGVLVAEIDLFDEAGEMLPKCFEHIAELWAGSI